MGGHRPSRPGGSALRRAVPVAHQGRLSSTPAAQEMDTRSLATATTCASSRPHSRCRSHRQGTGGNAPHDATEFRCLRWSTSYGSPGTPGPALPPPTAGPGPSPGPIHKADRRPTGPGSPTSPLAALSLYGYQLGHNAGSPPQSPTPTGPAAPAHVRQTQDHKTIRLQGNAQEPWSTSMRRTLGTHCRVVSTTSSDGPGATAGEDPGSFLVARIGC